MLILLLLLLLPHCYNILYVCNNDIVPNFGFGKLFCLQTLMLISYISSNYNISIKSITTLSVGVNENSAGNNKINAAQADIQ